MKYAIITYIFGKGNEILRTPLVKDNIEYICVTDQKSLVSSDWKIIYDEIPQAKCTRDKMVYVKYNPFKYTTADKICIIDGTLEITNSLIPLFEQLKDNDMLVKLHPERDNLFDELNAWVRIRGLSSDAIPKFQIMAKYHKMSLKFKFLLETCVIVYSRHNNVVDLCEQELSYMSFLGHDGNMFMSNQCVLSFLLQLKQLKLGFINQKHFFRRYKHNTYELQDR